ncbi:MAG TPA: GspH/FimT family pseudopilin [Vicinamibacterales bacterium]|nr:GspH/FimT family pseudopilin [Vicinamibacterales bacterium]
MIEPCDPRARGAALIDLVVACGLMVVLAAIAIPTLQASRDRDAVRMAARHLTNVLQRLRVEAVRRNRSVAIRFDPDDLGRYATYADGDGDGVLQVDIDRDIDPPFDEPAHVRHFFSTVELRVASTVPVPDGPGVVPAGSDPIRIGSTNLVSFSATGSSTSGTIYLAARDGSQMCIRLLGTTGRVRVLRFDRTSGAWRQD